MTACSLVQSSIIHVRHGTPSHRLERQGLSIWIDLDQLDQADQQSPFFSVNRFNLLSFHEKDYGSNFKSKTLVMPLAKHARQIAHDIAPSKDDVVSGFIAPRNVAVKSGLLCA